MTDIITVPPKLSGPKLLKTRLWIHRAALFMAIFTPVFFAAAALGSRFGVWDWTFGFGKLTRDIGMKLVFATLALGVLSLLAAVFVKPRKGWWIAVLAILVPIVALGKAASVQRAVAALPLIHDITTDTQNPPVFSSVIQEARAEIEGVNTLDYVGKTDLRDKTLFSVLQVRDYPEIRPLILSEDPAIVYGQALATAKAMGWDVVYEDAGAGMIDAVATTAWFGFKDDVAIRVQPANGGGTVVHMRSVSRVGASDLGANAARISSFMERMSPK